METKKLKEIIEAHGKWLRGEADGVRADLSNAYLRNANMRGADMSGADMSKADMSKADMSGADLSIANLRNANMSGVNMHKANMRGANMRGADMSGADMSKANLRNANMSGANMRGADMPERIVQVGPLGSRKDYTIYWVDHDVVQCGCWNNYKGGSLEEFKKRIDEVYPDGKYRDEYIAAIAMFEALKEQKARREAEKE